MKRVAVYLCKSVSLVLGTGLFFKTLTSSGASTVRKNNLQLLPCRIGVICCQLGWRLFEANFDRLLYFLLAGEFAWDWKVNDALSLISNYNSVRLYMARPECSWDGDSR